MEFKRRAVHSGRIWTRTLCRVSAKQEGPKMVVFYNMDGKPHITLLTPTHEWMLRERVEMAAKISFPGGTRCFPTCLSLLKSDWKS